MGNRSDDPLKFGASAPDGFDKFPCFRFSEEAQQVFIKWMKDMHCSRMPSENEPLIQQHLSKYDKLFPALALIFHLVDCAASVDNFGDRFLVAGSITKEAAERAAAWCEYLEAHARRCYGLLKDDGLRSAMALTEKLKRGALEDGFTINRRGKVYH